MGIFNKDTNPIFPFCAFSNFYFWYFAFVGAFFPYFALYLNWLGYDALEISILLAIGPLARVFSPYLWGTIADHFGNNKILLLVLALGAFICFFGLFLASGFLALASGLIFFSILMSGVLPIAEARTFRALGDNSILYGHIRLWGSVGFILAVVLTGLFFENFGLSVFHGSVIFFLGILSLSIVFIPKEKLRDNKKYEHSIFTVFSNPGVILAFTVFFCMQLAHGPLNGFLSLYLEEQGYTKISIGLFWGVSVVSEIVLFFYLPKMLKVFSIKSILATSAFLAFVRFLLIGWYAEFPLVLCVGQLLHAFTFGAFHAAGIAAINKVFTFSSAVRGQALYTSVGYGAGGGLGVLLSGLAWSHFGGAWMFTGGALFALLTFLLICFVPRVFD